VNQTVLVPVFFTFYLKQFFDRDLRFPKQSEI
jgi:hypothetical protein